MPRNLPSGYFPLFAACNECPEPRGLTGRNVGMIVLCYGGIWLLWLVINRFLVDECSMVDAYLNFCQVCFRLS